MVLQGKLTEQQQLLVGNSCASGGVKVAVVATESSSSTVKTQSSTTHTIRLWGLLLLWYVFNVLYNIENKRALMRLPLPYTVATAQLFVGWVHFVVAWSLGLQARPRVRGGWWAVLELTGCVAAQGICHLMVHAGAVVSMGAGAVSFTHIVKSGEPVLTCLLSYLFLREVLHPYSYCTLLLVVIGVALASVQELSFTPLAFAGAMLSNLGSSSRAIIAKSAMKRKRHMADNLSPSNLFALLTIAATLFSIPLLLIAEGPELLAIYQHLKQAGSNNHNSPSAPPPPLTSVPPTIGAVPGAYSPSIVPPNGSHLPLGNTTSSPQQNNRTIASSLYSTFADDGVQSNQRDPTKNFLAPKFTKSVFSLRKPYYDGKSLIPELYLPNHKNNHSFLNNKNTIDVNNVNKTDPHYDLTNKQELKTNKVNPLQEPPEVNLKSVLYYILLSGFYYYLYNEIAFEVLERVNQITHAVANTLKRVFVIFISIIVFHNPVNSLGIIGSVIAILGAFLYSVSKATTNVSSKAT